MGDLDKQIFRCVRGCGAKRRTLKAIRRHEKTCTGAAGSPTKLKKGKER